MAAALRSQLFNKCLLSSSRRLFSSKIGWTLSKPRQIQILADQDVVYRVPDSDFAVVRMTPEHIPLVYPTLAQFFYQETISKALKIEPKKEWMQPFVENVCRYPMSYFLINETNSTMADAILLQEMVYRDPAMDPIPRQKVKGAKDDTFNILGAMIDFMEQRMFELIPQMDKVIHSEIILSLPHIRGQGLGGLLGNVVIQENLEINGPMLGVDGCIGIITSNENRGNLGRKGYETVETLPDSFYVDFEGRPFRPAHGDPNASLVFFDFEKAREDGQQKRRAAM